MGESSAKNLRAETMDDVIFNGSTHRNPAGQAWVELYFDNAEGKLGGEYAQYPEIVIRRQVTLDGQSTYYLNNTVCRRRDIRDIFMGTGLGPRSYAIIEQGMISRLIEAKPEELRIYLEEAAGISKYKERRRETELRLQHTRDNLARLSDLRDELQKQLDHLTKQAHSAEKYQLLKNQEESLRAQLVALRATAIENQLVIAHQEMGVRENQLEKMNADYQGHATQRETDNQHYTVANDTLQEAQRIFYQLNTELARLEQNLAHQRERYQQLEKSLQTVLHEKETAEAQLVIEQEHQEALTQKINQALPEATELKILSEQARERFHQLETQQQDWQHQWDTFNQTASQHSREAQVEQTRIQHVEKHLCQLQERLTRLELEKEKMLQGELPLGIKVLQENIELTSTDLLVRQKEVDGLHEQLQCAREKHHENQKVLDEARTVLQSSKGRFSSLQALQEAALGKNSTSKVRWLQAHQLHDKPRLAQQLKVEPGYELAVETLLSDYLEAICVDQIDPLFSQLSDLKESSLTFIESSVQQDNKTVNPDLLIHKIKAPAVISNLLRGIYVADNLREAQEKLTQLSPAESVMTRDGIWLGRGWLRVKAQDDKAGVIVRERELADTQKEIGEKIETVETFHLQLVESQQLLLQLESERDQAQKTLSALSARYSDLNAQLQVQQGQFKQTEQRKVQLIHEIDELHTQQSQEDEQLKTTRAQWQLLMENMHADADIREKLQKDRETLRGILVGAREAHHEAQQKAHQLITQLEVLQTQRGASDEHQVRLQRQVNTLAEKTVHTQQTLQDLILPQENMTQALTQLLTQQQAAEHTVQGKREAVSIIEHQLRELEKMLHQLELERTKVRTHLEEQRLDIQSQETRLSTLIEKLQELNLVLTDVQAALPPEAVETEWEVQLVKTASRMERLGPINLAAISELAQQSERKNYLDQQNDDLASALQTLETAIHKIDKETRGRFKEVYEKVNGLFQALFPRIFGGGNAYLELTGDDLLQTGVNVIARPPGKKNSTIHLLSGGEKALTAIALIFSIFQLNPAPFCMLDEVDAPLDDANIVRFCDLVKEMAKTIQFIFISHNKLAIEISTHLIGVTMQEPGVSRLVAVDVNAAVAMAQA